MGLWLEGWSGDNAGNLAGRQPNQLLITVTYDSGAYPTSLLYKSSFQGYPWHPRVNLTCLTPGSRYPMAIGLEGLSRIASHVWSIELAEVDWLENKNPWVPGVHLFAVMLQEPGGVLVSTLATACIDENITRILYQPEDPPPIDWLLARQQT